MKEMFLISAQSNLSDKIVLAFLDLVQKEGYKGATTRKIAQAAGVNESTIFRHFKDKKNLLYATVNKFIDTLEAQEIVNADKLTGDIEADVITISKGYQTYANSYQAIILLGIRESVDFPEINETISQVPIYFKNLFADYLQEMKQKKCISPEVNPSTQAMNFFWLNFGYFLTQTKFNDKELKIEETVFLEENIRFFAKSLKA
ncbi:TetR/AcrR family transcriptional regulator [Vagococcus entomophilus]|uniref:HTH tetR-type domain-containing protein n=1 Tax=Vagococcus entomophilus TaxID=1160095 RepID=A0A430AKI5_9ENTE|nr:TetR/AcrR family transcriptional regulator [Vagococcus entomophilus]RSU08622.1 hypothetical protein CBF30_05180 [Vagococcus entomophilus]